MDRAFFLLLTLILLTLNQALAQVNSLTIKNFSLYRFEGKSLILKLKASFFSQKEEGSFMAKDLEVENPKKGISIKAKFGNYDKATNSYRFQGDVELKTEKGEEVYAQELIYRVKEELLHIPGKALIRKSGVTIEGMELYYHLTTGELRFKRSVKAKFSL